MNVSLGERREKFVETTVRQGRYSSASEVVREGLRLVEEREATLTALRETLNASTEVGGDVSEEDLDSAKDDLVSALRCIARESGSLAVGKQLVGALRRKRRRLAGLPGHLGRPRPELLAEVRS